MDPLLRRRPARERELRVGQRLEVGAVLAQDRQRARRVEHLPVAGDDRGRLLDQRLEARERREVGAARAALRQRRQLDRRQVVAAHEHPRPRDPDRHPGRGVAVGGVQLELLAADVELAGHRQGLDLA
ncbi:MAG TPA: hypothetical protein VGW10_15135, partial [Solirubrobacteraceae bacterium]|nr:hypothetical protein [Solirubrobacteraceae bacterium]